MDNEQQAKYVPEEPYAVIVVLDRGFGDRLLSLPPGVPVWIIDTPTNRTAAKTAWESRRSKTDLNGVTTFKSNENASAEEIFIGQLGTIDLHHGSYSADPAYTVVEAIGATLTDPVKAAMAEFGFNEFHPTDFGFRAVRPLPENEVEIWRQ